MPVPTNWHPGEIAAQQARGFEDDVWGMWEGYQEGAPDWMTMFLSQLPFLSVTTLDAQGRPWCSLVCRDGKTGFIQPTAEEHVVRFTINAPFGVPIRECLMRLHERFTSGESAFEQSDNSTAKPAFQMAAVGVMLHNRRRNKMEGVITAVERVPADDTDDAFVFVVRATNTFGNCPKYINARLVLPANEEQRVSTALTSQHDGQDLPADALKAVVQTDLLYLATKYSGHDPDSFRPDPPRLGNNHRGGPAGFLRTYWDAERERRCIVLPDWSGNRFLMSIGNMSKDPVAGIAIPAWSGAAQQSSGVLHLTCSVRVLANDEAQRLMRGVRGATMLWVESWSWLASGWPVYVGKSAAATAPEVAWSPYNPPVRLLQREQTYDVQAEDASMSVKMVNARFWTEQLATFTFALANAGLASRYTPGQHIVVDCYDLLDTRVQMYTHMAQFRGGEKDLNDDGTRSWTISHAGETNVADDAWQFELTLRRKPRGGVTPTLFRQGQQLREMLADGMQAPSSWNVKMRALGVDGSTVLPAVRAGRTSLSLAYVLSGIGLTPLLPHIADLARRGDAHAKLSVIVATRHDEAQATQHIIHHALTRDVAASSSTARIDVLLCLLVSASVPDDEEKGDGSVDEALWQQVPPGVRVSVTSLQGIRLAPDSLSSGAIRPSAEDGYDDVDMAVVCAAPAYAGIAQKALTNVGVPADKIHVESFSF